jgi:hypothetical protein
MVGTRPAPRLDPSPPHCGSTHRHRTAARRIGPMPWPHGPDTTLPRPPFRAERARSVPTTFHANPAWQIWPHEKTPAPAFRQGLAGRTPVALSAPFARARRRRAQGHAQDRPPLGREDATSPRAPVVARNAGLVDASCLARGTHQAQGSDAGAALRRQAVPVRQRRQSHTHARAGSIAACVSVLPASVRGSHGADRDRGAARTTGRQVLGSARLHPHRFLGARVSCGQRVRAKERR